MSELIKIYIGSDRSQNLATRVLQYSIKRHTKNKTYFYIMDNLSLPQPVNLRHTAYTNFSFNRFAIPKLCDYRGKAIYLDADMIVFKDIIDLWEINFNNKSIILQKELPSNLQIIKGKKRKKQTAVMLLDCYKLRWDPIRIINNLGEKYTYKELMSELCILDNDDIEYAIPFIWNSIEFKNDETALLHYTDIETQPWVSPLNNNAKYWIDELQLMLADKIISKNDIQKEIDLGFIRPSLLYELGFKGNNNYTPQELLAIDKKSGYKKHHEVMKRMHIRKASSNLLNKLKDLISN